jgi:hypothetical protein
MTTPASPLEDSYRRALRAYPASWRVRYEDEFIGVMLDVAESQQRTRPTRTELLDLVLRGITTQVLTIVGKVAPARRRDRVSAAATIIASSLAVIMMALGELGRWFRWNSYTTADAVFGPFTSAAATIYLPVIASFIALAFGRQGLRKLLLLLALLACLAMPVLTNPTNDAAVVGWHVPAVFAVASVVALGGNPIRSQALARTVFRATPILAMLLTCTSYLQGGGAQKTFYGSELVLFDSLRLTRSAAEILLLATVLLLSNRKLLPWTVLVGVIAMYFPMTRLFMMLGGNPALGLIGIHPGTILAICCLVAPIAAWIAWKRPRIEFPSPDKETSGN